MSQSVRLPACARRPLVVPVSMIAAQRRGSVNVSVQPERTGSSDRDGSKRDAFDGDAVFKVPFPNEESERSLWLS